MNTDRVADQTVSKIQTEIVKGSEALSRMHVRAEINQIIRDSTIESEATSLLQMTPGELMVDLAKRSIIIWPCLPELAFQSIQECLRPLKDIANILNSQDVNKSVHVRDDPCVMKDPRMPLNEFKRAILQQLFRQTSDDRPNPQ
jgi:hypothetical protein